MKTIYSGILIVTFILTSSIISLAQQRGVGIKTQENQTSEKRLALIIGNSDYKFTDKLNNPVNDASDMAAALKELGFEVISGMNQTLPQMRKSIREFGAKLQQQKGVGLFYYAGHGIQAADRNFLIPVDAQIESEIETEDFALDVNSVLRQMDAAGNGFNIVILDACRNNPFARSWNRELGSGGLAQINAPTGTFIAYATAPNRTAADGYGRNGLYTTELLKYLKESGLKIEEVFKEVTKAVDRASRGKQIPWVSSSLRGDFYFRPGERKNGTSTNSKIDVPEKLPSAEQILEKYFQAIGGKTAMRNLQSLSRRGEFEISVSGRRGTGIVTEFWKAPNKSFTEMKVSTGEVAHEGFDGTTGWLKGSYGYAQMSGQQLEVKKRNAALNFTADIADFKKIYPQIKLKGRETQNGKEFFVIEAEPPVGKPDLLYFDAQSGLLARLDFLSESSFKKGVLVPTQMYFEEYTEINGVMLPFVFRELNSSYSNIIRFDPLTVKFNNSINDAKFQPPQDKGKALSDTIKEYDATDDIVAEASEQAAQKNYDEAIKLYTKAIEISPISVRAYNQRGLIYILQNRYDKAIADFTAAIKIVPFDSVFYFNRGIAYFKKNDFNSAIENFNKAIEIMPASVNYYSSRCAAFLNTGRNNQALSDCSKAIELNATQASLYLDRSVVYERMGRKDLAAADYRKYKELSGK